MTRKKATYDCCALLKNKNKNRRDYKFSSPAIGPFEYDFLSPFHGGLGNSTARSAGTCPCRVAFRSEQGEQTATE